MCRLCVVHHPDLEKQSLALLLVFQRNPNDCSVEQLFHVSSFKAQSKAPRIQQEYLCGLPRALDQEVKSSSHSHYPVRASGVFVSKDKADIDLLCETLLHGLLNTWTKP